MPKNLFEDMVRIKREKRASVSLDSVEPTNSLNTQKIIKQREAEDPVYSGGGYSTEKKFASVYDVALGGENKKGTKYTMWFTAGISVIVLLFALSYLFAAASITINPKNKPVVLNQTIMATKDSATSDDLSFDLVVLSGEETKSILGGEEKEVLTRAKGTVIIYNDFGTAPQNLDIDTRLEGSNGKIYKTVTKTTVPGKSKDGKPGSVEVGVYAAEPGEAYNSGPLDFKIFGFKGTPKYAKFYARSKDKIAGGWKGMQKVVSPEEKASTIAELEKNLETKLFKKAADQIPAGFILFKDASFLETEEVDTLTKASALPNTETMVPVTIKGTMYGILFDEKKLTTMLAEDLVPDYNGEEVYIPNMEKLTFALSQEDQSLKDAKSINFKLTGNARVVWKVDSEKFTQDILGKPKKDFEKILANYPNISNAKVSIRPIWKLSFPEKSKNVTVVVNEPA